MTSKEALKRAKSHKWMELNADNERCIVCQIILPKSTDLENVPGCAGRVMVRR